MPACSALDKVRSHVARKVRPMTLFQAGSVIGLSTGSRVRMAPACCAEPRLRAGFLTGDGRVSSPPFRFRNEKGGQYLNRLVKPSEGI